MHLPLYFERALLFGCCLILCAAPLRASTITPMPSDQLDRAQAPASVELADYQDRLLTVAIDSASALPVKPHLKTRSRLQEAVIEASFRLDQPERALAYAERIENWRRGAAHADYAHYLVRNARSEGVREHLESAAEVVTELERGQEQAWRRDRVRAKIARVYLLLDEPERAAAFLDGLVSSEFAPVAVVAAQRFEDEEFEGAIAAQEAVIELGDFEQARASLYLFSEFHDRFYADAERRDRCEVLIRKAWHKLPLDVRIDFLSTLADHAIAHEDPRHAQQLLDEAQSLVEGVDWLPRHLVPLLGRLAGYRARAGDVQRARLEAANALAIFEAEREGIVDIFRPESLVPVAEAYKALENDAKAREIYALALEEAVHNPNSRPRAEDLVGIACSMAVQRVEPEEKLWKRILEVQAALGDPW